MSDVNCGFTGSADGAPVMKFFKSMDELQLWLVTEMVSGKSVRGDIFQFVDDEWQPVRGVP